VPVPGAIRSLTLLVDSISPQASPGDPLTWPGQAHVDHVAQGLLREVGDAGAHQAGAGVDAGPQVILAVTQVSW
jgi:hypothetical protein